MNRRFGTHTDLTCTVRLMREHFRVETMPPPLDLADIVSEFWQFKPRGTASYVPTQMFPSLSGRIRFLIRESGVETLVYGPSLSSNRKGLYFANDESFIVTLHPLGLHSVFGSNTPDLFSRRTKVKTILGTIVGETEERLQSATSFQVRAQIISAFLRSCRRDQQDNGLLEAALVELGSRPRSVSTIAKDLSISRRTLHRRFANLGIPPKGAARIVRMQQCLQSLIAGGEDVQLPLLSFADQSHLIREFRDLVGVTPGQFVASLPCLSDPSYQPWSNLTPEIYAFGYPDQTVYE